MLIDISGSDNLLSTMFIIFTGVSIIATLALYTKQTILAAYIILGIIVGPSGFGFITEPALIDSLSQIGIIFLLFLLGLSLDPRNLLHLLQGTSLITLASSIIFAFLGFLVAYFFKFSILDSIIVACCMMFSSTIISLKLLPTNVLHSQKTGEVVISILLLQDLLAILLLLLLDLFNNNISNLEFNNFLYEIFKILITLPSLIMFAFIVEYYILNKLYKKFDVIKEYLFIVTIGWCLSITELANFLGLSYEVGAFIAGVALASNTISLYIYENFKPLRDFFLVIFFVALGASFDITIFMDIAIPALVLAVVMLVFKPYIFSRLLLIANMFNKTEHFNMNEPISWEIGTRLGQLSEFSLLIIYLASNNFNLSNKLVSLIQSATIISFIVSSYLVTIKYKTPLSYDNKLRMD